MLDTVSFRVDVKVRAWIEIYIQVYAVNGDLRKNWYKGLFSFQSVSSLLQFLMLLPNIFLDYPYSAILVSPSVSNYVFFAARISFPLHITMVENASGLSLRQSWVGISEVSKTPSQF